MIRYKAVVPSSGKTDPKGEPLAPFNGWTCGVRFQDGVAFFDDLTMRKDNKRTALEAATTMRNDFGYHVTVINPDTQAEEPFEPKELVPARPTPAAAGPKPRARARAGG